MYRSKGITRLIAAIAVMRALFIRLTTLLLIAGLGMDPSSAAAVHGGLPDRTAPVALFVGQALELRPLMFLRHPARRPYVKLVVGLFVTVVGFRQVLMPEVRRYTAVMTDQVGMSQIGTQPAQDFAGSYGGAKAYFDYHINSYDNKAMWDLYNDRTGSHRLSAHPAINSSLSGLLLDRSANGLGQAGYVPAPPNLWFGYAVFVRWLPFDQAVKVWALVSSAVVAGMIMLFGWALSRDRSLAGKWGDALIAVTLFFIAYRPVQDSIILGNIDSVLYAFFAGLAVYVFAFQRERAWAWKAATLLLALATGLKIAPVVVAGYFAIGLAQKLFRRHPFKAALETRVLVWFVGGLAAVAGITLATIRWEVIASWAPKIREFSQIPVDPLSAPTLWRYLHFWMPQLFGEEAASFADVGLWLARLGAVFLVLRIIARRGREWISRTGLDARHFLLYVATILALLPTLSPHWWFTYNSAMILPFLILYHEVKSLPKAGARRAGIFALAAAYGIINMYGLYVADYSGLSPLFDSFRRWLIAATTHYNSAEGFIHSESLLNLFSAYPGTVLLAVVAGWLWRYGGRPALQSVTAPAAPRGARPDSSAHSKGSRRDA